MTSTRTHDDTARWRGVIPDEELAVFRNSGGRDRIPIGGRIALLVIDMTYDFTGDPGEEHLKSLEKFPSSCGPHAWEAIPHIERTIALARRHELPIVYTRAPSWTNPFGTTEWSRSRRPHPLQKTPASKERGNVIPDVIAPRIGDLVIEKTKASAFFGTPLHSYLNDLGIDTILVTGCTTSGCVRASVLDAHYLNYGVNVVEEAVFDRSVTSHRVNLFDMDMKYANVLPIADITTAVDAAVGGRAPGAATGRERAAS